jgi:hypothetical protein
MDIQSFDGYETVQEALELHFSFYCFICVFVTFLIWSIEQTLLTRSSAQPVRSSERARRAVSCSASSEVLH